MAGTACWAETPDGVDLFVRVSPNARSEGCDGIFVDASGRARLKLRLRAVPEDGRANKALIAMVAEAMGRPRADVTILSGAASRLKTLRIAGPGADLVARLQGWMNS
jgi:uncharacterized protein (TIGR00251 family)